MPQNKGYLTAKTDVLSDEYYTPDYAVQPLIKHLQSFSKGKKITVWCPFDTEQSQFVKVLKNAGFNVIYSHIDFGENFFFFEPKEDYDIIISNPPFSAKDKILQRLNELQKPYAILLPLPSLQGQNRFKYLKDSQALIFNKRINYWKNIEQTEMVKGVSFASIYVCKNFLEKDLIFEEI